MRNLKIDDSIMIEISSIQSKHNFNRETGGILVGVYDARQKAVRITDMSFAYSSDKRNRFYFNRKSKGHQEYIDELWEKSAHTKAYLGEWHTHNQDVPMPSLIDKNSWRRIAKQPNNFDNCYFMIIGRKCTIIWTVENNTVIEIERI